MEILNLDFGMTGAPSSLTSANATDQWLMQGAGPVANEVGTATLANDSGTLGVQALGLWNGTDFVSLDSWQSGATAANTDTLVASDTAAGDSNNVDLAAHIVFSVSSDMISGDYLMGKAASLGTAGWTLGYNTGQVQFTITDGSNTKALSKTVAAADVGDSAKHWIKVWYDKSADMMYMQSDLWDFEEDVSSSNVTGSLTNAGNFQVNGYAGAAQTNGQANLAVYDVALAVGAGAEALYDEDIPLHGHDVTGLLSTISLPADLTVPVSASDNNIVQHNRLPIAYNANLTPTFGLWCNETADTDFRTVGDHLNESAGEVTSVFTVNTLPGVGELHYVFDTGAADGVNYYDRRALYLDESGLLSFLVTDAQGTTVAIIDLGTVSINTEYTAVTQWNEAGGLDSGSVRVKLNALDGKSSGLAFTSGGLYSNQLCIGSSESTASTQLDGVIQSITSYDDARAMAGTVSYSVYTLPAYGLVDITLAADPMQALIDAMGHDTKPDYLWIGHDEGNGATELGGSGLRAVGSGANKPTQGVSDSRFGSVDVCTLDSNAEWFKNSDASLQFGSASFAVIQIYAVDSYPATGGIFGTYDGTDGVNSYVTSAGHRQQYISSAGNIYYATVAINHGTVNAQVDLTQRKVSDNSWDLHTREGSHESTETIVGNATSTNDLRVIGSPFGSSFRGKWGLTAIWYGASSENVTNAMRAALLTALNL